MKALSMLLAATLIALASPLAALADQGPVEHLETDASGRSILP